MCILPICTKLEVDFVMSYFRTSINNHFYSKLQWVVLSHKSMYFWQNHYKESQQQGGVASFVSWVSSGVTTISLPSLTEKLSSAQQFGWLSYLILDMETKTEEETKLWPLLRAEMANDTKQSLDLALKVRVQFTCPMVEIQIQNAYYKFPWCCLYS